MIIFISTNSIIVKLEERIMIAPMTAYVIGIGVINMTSGITGHKWNIYDKIGGQTRHAFLTSQGCLLIGAKETFKVGQKEITLRDNDSQRKKMVIGEIIGAAPCIKDELLAMLKEHRYDYTPIRAFRKRPQGNRKLMTSYSIKGTEFTK